MNKVKNEKKRLITSALPYVNNEPHLGNLIQVLSADVFARFSRLKGYDTFYVCGTDEYGTATETKALESGKSEYKLCGEYHKLHTQIYKWFNISFDNFSRISNATHTQITQQIFADCYNNGYIERKKTEQFYCPECKRFLADRFVKGKCSKCGAEAAGDQCDNCGSLLDANHLAEPKCTICGSTPFLKETENLFLNLPKLKEKLEKFIDCAEKEKRWSKNAVSVARGWLENGLRERSITRDLKWGIKVPLESMKDKVFYVWFDAPIGYISLTAMKLKDSWKEWWQNPENVDLYHFIGKDNIPFHTVIFPASLMATGRNWTFVKSISSSEYLNFEGGKFSKSRGVGVFGSDCQKTGIESDLWRFYLMFNRPEKSDSDFSFDDLKERINSDIVGNFSNLINRAVVFAQKEFAGCLKQSSLDTDFYQIVKQKISEWDMAFENQEIREAVRIALGVCDIANKYFQDNEPWKLAKNDVEKCKKVLWTLWNVIKDIAIMFSPFMPCTFSKIKELAGLNTLDYEMLGEVLTQDITLSRTEHLFDRISDERIVALKEQFSEKKENNKDSKEGNKMSEMAKNFANRVNLKVSKIVNVEKHPAGDRLYILRINTGEAEERTIVSSIVPYYKPEELLNHNIVLVANLKPANFRGVKSFGMLLAASDKNDDTHSTCEVLFADDFEVGTDLFPEGEDITQAQYGTYIKGDDFFDMPLYTENGEVKIDGVSIVDKKGHRVTAKKYINGNVG